MNYDTIQDLHDLFVNNQLDSLPDSLCINGVSYNQPPVNETFVLFDNQYTVMVYESECEDPQQLALVWERKNLTIQPLDVINVTQFLSEKTKLDPELDVNSKPDVIDDKCDVVLIGFNDNNPIEARVDTGAAQCSLHGEAIKWSTDNDLVQFTFNGKRYRMNLVGEQKISSSDGGTSERPVVSFKVKLNGKLFENIQFNINDRQHMPHEILIGQNLLQHGNFLINPTGAKQTEAMSTEQVINMLIEHISQ